VAKRKRSFTRCRAVTGEPPYATGGPSFGPKR
jgi:hypothetical protein